MHGVQNLTDWIQDLRELLEPSRVMWVDGTERQASELMKEAIWAGELIPLNQDPNRGCHL
jgi:phosphoenolpyruvate carboxykinase (GTP)